MSELQEHGRQVPALTALLACTTTHILDFPSFLFLDCHSGITEYPYSEWNGMDQRKWNETGPVRKVGEEQCDDNEKRHCLDVGDRGLRSGVGALVSTAKDRRGVVTVVEEREGRLPCAYNALLMIGLHGLECI